MTIPELLTQWETDLIEYQTNLKKFNKANNYGSAKYWSNRITELELRIEQVKEFL